MKDDFVFRMNFVELYRNGQWVDTPKVINQKNSRKRIATWTKTADLHEMESLRHSTTCTEYTADQRYTL